ncbi:hypothetical protein DCAR_0520270 [Daucus carota subsp. sativus]|uniref:Cysteine protease n=1 Tax=Daucus carota subsp. sativus TaxID=79200 RepID=A0AAF0X5W1_DAUCS|nr:PREDICTED: low-temperature-induced cysteine proteinase-like [Daucus carota subsp. sativus]WOH00894.1 hypothetical protein DCAR_0520270 [Daucus carota subsp. sativus]
MTRLWSFLVPTLLLCIPCIYSSPTSDLFEAWCISHGKTYSSQQEKLHRLKIFEENYFYITQHNNNHIMAANSSFLYTLSVDNAFADLTHQEFKASRLGLSANGLIRMNLGGSSKGSDGVANVPTSLDWRDKGAVTNVKDQGSCGACWSFSATGAIEGINQIVTGSLTSLSEQELVDCDRSYNNGCEGGLMDYAYQFVIKNKGIDTEDDYPYQSRDTTCNKNKLKKHVVTIDGYIDVRENDEKELLAAVAAQPVSVGICGSERNFQLYSKGIFNGPCSTSLDHAVLIVGYGSENGVDYWIVKNSWGKQWGMNGYMHMQRNSGNSQGICGINMMASYPTKTSPNPPPSPSPGPAKCSLLTSCSEGETCCCARTLFGICLSWKCCELNAAVCCDDHRHCCPQDYPICDTKRNMCLKQTGNYTLVKEFKNKKSSGKLSGWIPLLGDWDL